MNSENENLSLQAIQKHARDWRAVAFSTEPLSKELAKTAVINAYLNADLEPPSRFVWVDSPLAGAVAAEILIMRYKNVAYEIYKRPPFRAMSYVTGDSKKQRESPEQEKTQKLFLSIVELYGRSTIERVTDVIHMQIDRGLNRLTRSDDISTARARFCFDWIGTLARLSEQLTVEEMQCITKWQYRRIQIGYSPRSWCLGNGGLEDGWYAWIDVLHSLKPLDNWNIFTDVFRHCGWWWPFEDICVLSERPSLILRDEFGIRPHCETGPAIVFRDNWKIFARRGSVVSRRVMHFKRDPTLRRIELEGNVETRRHMIEIYGYEAYVRDTKAKVIAKDDFGSLLRIEQGFRVEPLVLLRVKNSTPEPDGTIKYYYLRVPPDMTTPHQAVAWTFNLDVDTYSPDAET